MNDRLHHIVAEILGVPVKSLTDKDGPNSIEAWDSMAHVNLVLAINAEFGVSLSPDEAVDILSVGTIRKLLRERGVTIQVH